MKQNVLDKVFYDTVRFIKCNSPTILSLIAVAGVVGTSISVGKATNKATKKLDRVRDQKGEKLNDIEIIAVVAPIFIPSILIGGSTIVCILGANVLNQRRQAALISAYALADNTFKEYREKLIELHGKEMDEEIRGEIARNHYDYHVLGIEHPDQKVLWYEPYSDTFFEMYEREVMDAEYHVNRNFILASSITLNSFLEMLGLPGMSEGDNIGWCLCDGYMWIDFEHELMYKSDGTPYYVIQSIFPPATEEEIEECGYSLCGGFM